jgi:TetR/AcrR family transcriptional regulator, mexJK operon transcriptional repressor
MSNRSSSLLKRQRSSAALKTPIPAKHAGRDRGNRTVATPGPGRPTAARVAHINRTILTAARKEFRTKGYEATRMEQIAAAAGVSKGTLYDRYPTKEAVLQAVIAYRVAQWSEDWAPDGEPAPVDLEQRLKQRAHKITEYCCSEEVQYIERLFMSGPPLDELRRMRYETGHRRTIQVIARDIVQGTRDQPVQPRTAIKLAEMLVAMIYGWSRARRDVGSVPREEALAYADHAVEVLLHGRSAWAGPRPAHTQTRPPGGRVSKRLANPAD